VFTGKNIEVEYDFNQNIVYEKIAVISLFVLGVLGFAIFFKRFKLEAFAETK
jgi:hypothetical protein